MNSTELVRRPFVDGLPWVDADVWSWAQAPIRERLTPKGVQRLWRDLTSAAVCAAWTAALARHGDDVRRATAVYGFVGFGGAAR